MEIQTILQAISSVGFPICVAAYCLYKLDNTTKENTETLKELATLIKILAEKINNEKGEDK